MKLTVKKERLLKGDSGEKAKNTSSLRHKINIPLTHVCLVVAVVVALLFNAGLYYWAQQKFIVSERLQQLATLAQEHSDNIAASVSIYLRKQKEQLQTFSQRPGLTTALATQDVKAIEKNRQQLQALFPSALDARVFGLKQAKLEPEAKPPLRFLELEMIRKAEKREPVRPEAIKFEGQWWVTHVTSVPMDAEAEVVGTLLVTWPISQLREIMESVGADLGQIKIHQSVSSQIEQEILNFGSGGRRLSQSSVIDHSYWSVALTPSEALWAQTARDYSRIYIGLVIVAILTLYLALRLGRLGDAKLAAVRGATVTTPVQAVEPAPSGVTQESSDAPTQPAEDILDIEISEEDEALLGLEDAGVSGGSDTSVVEQEPIDQAEIPEVVFRAYDIRGLVPEEINPTLAEHIGQSVGSEALDNGQSALVVGRDGRTHSEELAQALIKGILSTGCNVINIGVVPTPVLYFATETLEETQSGVMVTASHNPRQYNGFKIVMAGQARADKDIRAIRERILKRNIYVGVGVEETQDVVSDYINTIFSDVALANEIAIVIDAANGATSEIAPQLFEEIGCYVTPLHCEIDGRFPNHDPDPSVAGNLEDLIRKVDDTGADIGVAFDGDGDRLAVVTPSGEIIWPDRLLMAFAKDIVARNPGADVVFDVKSTRQLNSCVSDYGGRPIIWKTGHSHMKNKMRETGALVGGEFSGHIFIKDRWYGFDDGLYAAARLLEIMSLCDEGLDEIFAEFPQLSVTPEIRIPVAEDKKFELIDKLTKEADFGDAKLLTLDGLRVEFGYGWGLVRASNTSPNLTLRFEAEKPEQLQTLKDLFARELQKIDSSIDCSF